MKPKYHVGDTLYRKDTQKKATIVEIKNIDFAPSMEFQPDYPILCYILSEPLNFKGMWCGCYIPVKVIDNDENYCDESTIQNSDFDAWINSYRDKGGDDRGYAYPIVKEAWKAGVLQGLCHPDGDGYHSKNSKEVSNDTQQYKVGDLLVYTDEEFHTRTFSLIKHKTTDVFIFSNHLPMWRRSMGRRKEHNIEYIGNNDNIRLATEKERYQWIEEQGEFHTGEQIVYNGYGFRITGKHILIENEKAGVYYSIDIEYKNTCTLPIEYGDKEFRRVFPYGCEDWGHIATH